MADSSDERKNNFIKTCLTENMPSERDFVVLIIGKQVSHLWEQVVLHGNVLMTFSISVSRPNQVGFRVSLKITQTPED